MSHLGRFGVLAAEIRDIIYDYVVFDEITVVRSSAVSPGSKDSDNKHGGSPFGKEHVEQRKWTWSALKDCPSISILAVSPTIFHEVLPFIYANAIFCFDWSLYEPRPVLDDVLEPPIADSLMNIRVLIDAKWYCFNNMDQRREQQNRHYATAGPLSLFPQDRRRKSILIEFKLGVWKDQDDMILCSPLFAAIDSLKMFETVTIKLSSTSYYHEPGPYEYTPQDGFVDLGLAAETYMGFHDLLTLFDMSLSYLGESTISDLYPGQSGSLDEEACRHLEYHPLDPSALVFDEEEDDLERRMVPLKAT